MARVTIQIDGVPVETEEGRSVLEAALDAGIYIPHICADPENGHRPASCRLCFVEIEGRDSPVLSCKEAVRPGLAVHTRSLEVDRLVKSAFALLMSTHRLDCKKCPANRNCVLQDIARQRKAPLKPRRLVKIEPDWPVDETREDFGLNPNHCVLCGRCVNMCNNVVGCRVLDFTERGLAAVVGTFDGSPLSEQDACDGCLRCVDVCPVGALYKKEGAEKKAG